MNKIPKIIHQTWKTDKIPEDLKKFQKTWIELNPDYTYLLWTDAQFDIFVLNYYPEYYKVFKNWKYHIQRVDMIRYMILDHFGGIYVDLDFECKKPMNELGVKCMNNHHFIILGQEPVIQAQTVYHLSQVVSNAIMISTAGHPLLHLVLQESCQRSVIPKYYKNILQSLTTWDVE